MKIEIAHLKLITTVVKEGSLTGAAKVLHLSQPALSRRLEMLESRLGHQVFHRVGKRLCLTESGRLLREAGERILPQINHLEKQVQQLSEGKSGEIRVSTECYTCYHWLPDLIARFRHEHPEITIEVDTSCTANPIKALQEGRIDIAIGTSHAPNSNLHFHPVFEDEVVAVLPKGHDLAGRAYITAEQLAEEHLIVYAAENCDAVNLFMHPAGVVPGRTSNVQVTDGILQMVKAGLGVTTLARWAIPDALLADLETLSLGKKRLKRQWYAVTLEEKPPNFIQHFIQLLSQHP